MRGDYSLLLHLCLRNTEVQAARELYFAHDGLVQERATFVGKSLARRIWELFAIPRIRRATVAAAWIVISQQFSGVCSVRVCEHAWLTS